MPSASEIDPRFVIARVADKKPSAHISRGGLRYRAPILSLRSLSLLSLLTRYGVTVNESMFSTLVVDCIAESMKGDVGSGVISPVVSLIL